MTTYFNLIVSLSNGFSFAESLFQHAGVLFFNLSVLDFYRVSYNENKIVTLYAKK